MGGERQGGLLHIRRRRGGPVPTKVRAYVLRRNFALRLVTPTVATRKCIVTCALHVLSTVDKQF